MSKPSEAGVAVARERPATPEDAPAMARLIDMAAHGLASYLWSTMAEPGVDPLAVGIERAGRETGDFCYRNATMLEVDGAAAACMVGDALPDEPEAIDLVELPPIVLPLVQLEAEASGTWYVNVLAVEPAWRGQGFGQRLLKAADRLAEDAGCAATSLIVADANHGARRLYARAGYAEVTSLPIIKNGWQSDSERWILYRKPR